MYVYYDQNVSTKSIGYFRLKTPNKITFTLDSNKIIHIKPVYNNFEVYNFHEKKEERWDKMKAI